MLREAAQNRNRISRETLATIFAHVEENGIGGDRSQGNGTCSITLGPLRAEAEGSGTTDQTMP